MPRIRFYTLEPDSPGDRFLLTCHLVDQAYKAQQRVFVYCPERESAQHLDRLLWTFRQDSFIPHGLVDQTNTALTPILIGQDEPPPEPGRLLINLDLKALPFISTCDEVWEPVDQDPAVRSAGRERFRQYRSQGYHLEHQAVRLDQRDSDDWFSGA